MILHYPALTLDEFTEACKQLERKCHGKLQGSSWTEVKWTGEELAILQIRPVFHRPANCQNEDSRDSEIDEHDPESLHRTPVQVVTEVTVNFSVVLSPTYQVPVLWFNATARPNLSVSKLDQIYDLIVSPQSENVLRQTGVLGGISMAHHPKSDMPAFFVHPCRTQEALEVVRPSVEIAPLEYLMLWFGIIGCAVGLTIPSAILIDE